jgi:signal transduction histidine kinase
VEEVPIVKRTAKEENNSPKESEMATKDSRVWLLYLLVGVLATGVYFLLPSASTQNILYDLIGFSAVVAIVVGVYMYRPTRVLQWYVLAFGLLILVLGEVVFTYYENVLGIESPFPSVADAFYLVAMPCLAAGLMLVHRRRVPAHQWAHLIDVLIIATVAGMLSWIFLMEPQTHDQTHSLLERLISISYPLMDLVLLIAVLQLWLVSEKRLPAYYLLNVSLVSLLVADTAYAATLMGGTYETGHPLDAGWLLFYVLFGAAALHPSMVALSEPRPYPETRLTWQRLALLTGTALIAPSLLVYQAASGEDIDVPVIFGGSVVLFLLVAARLASMISKSKRDEEEMKEANQRLEELALLKADFTAIVAHELGGPVAAIRRLTEVLSAEGSNPEIRSYATATIESEINALDALIADVQASSAVERDDFRVELRPVPLSELLADAKAFSHTLPANHPVDFVFNPNLGLYERVVADPERIGQVLRNLLSNAAKYSPEGVPIELRVERELGHIRLEVADHGLGIHPEDVVRIFEKFGRGRDRDGKKIAGVGLGLYLSRGIVQAHGGDITVSSVPGEGAVFGFELEVAR